MSTATVAPEKTTCATTAPAAETAAGDQRVTDLISTLTAAVHEASVKTPREGVSLGVYAALHQTIENARAELARLDDQVTASAAALPHEKRTVVGGIGVVEFHYKSNRTRWDHDVVLAAIWEASCLDTATGEVSERPDPARLLSVLTGSFGLTASTGWKVTELRQNVPDLDLDEARTISPGPLAMRII